MSSFFANLEEHCNRLEACREAQPVNDAIRKSCADEQPASGKDAAAGLEFSGSGSHCLCERHEPGPIGARTARLPSSLGRCCERFQGWSSQRVNNRFITHERVQ